MFMAINFGGMPWGIIFRKVTRSFDHVVLQGHVKCFSYFIAATQGLWSLNLARWWLAIRNFNPLSHTTLWTRSHVRLHDILKAFYLHYHNTHGHQITCNEELPPIKSHDHLITWFSDSGFSNTICGFRTQTPKSHRLLVCYVSTALCFFILVYQISVICYFFVK